MTAKTRIKKLEKARKKTDDRIFIIGPEEGVIVCEGQQITQEQFEAMRSPDDLIIEVTYSGDDPPGGMK